MKSKLISTEFNLLVEARTKFKKIERETCRIYNFLGSNLYSDIQIAHWVNTAIFKKNNSCYFSEPEMQKEKNDSLRAQLTEELASAKKKSAEKFEEQRMLETKNAAEKILVDQKREVMFEKITNRSKY